MFNSTLQILTKVIIPRTNAVLPRLPARLFASQASRKVSVDNRFVVLQSNEATSVDEPAKQFKYPIIWLRDNCHCDKCYHASSKSRTINWETFDFDRAVPKSVSVS